MFCALISAQSMKERLLKLVKEVLRVPFCVRTLLLEERDCKDS
jgi:hypothetical protein